MNKIFIFSQIYEVIGVYYPEQKSVHVIKMERPEVNHIQNDAILPGHDKFQDIFSKILFGDELSAKLLLSSMVSEVYLR